MSYSFDRDTGGEWKQDESKSGGRSERTWKDSETTSWIGGSCEAALPGTMSALSWNCRGLRNPLIVKTLQKIVKEEDPTLVFLMETKFKATKMEGVKRKTERQHGLVVPSQNRGGGLALLWRSTLKVDPLTYSPRRINVMVNEEDEKKKWRFIGFYGDQKMSKREESWALIRNLNSKCKLPWVIIGDFNEFLHAKKKERGNVRPEGQMKVFRDIIDSCGLRDMGYIRSDFNWSRRLGAKG